MTRSLPLLILLLLTGLAYLPLREAGFVYEDRNPEASLDLRALVDARGPWEGWAREREHLQLAPRMLTNVTMRLQGWAHATARGYHAGNVAIHLINGALLWILLLPIGAGAAVIGATLFLLHPINSEAVSYISARPDLLYATAVLLLLIASARDTWPSVLAVTVAGGLAVLAKESAIVVVGLLPVWLLIRGRWAPRWAVPVGLWAAGGLAVVYRLVHVSARAGAAHPWGAIFAYTAASAHGPIGYALIQAAALGRLLLLVVSWGGLSIDHDVDVVPLAVGALAAGGLVAGAVVSVTEWHRWPWLTFAVAWLLVSLGLRFLLPMPEYVHEQHLYVPLLGVWIAVAAALSDRVGSGIGWLSGRPSPASLITARGQC